MRPHISRLILATAILALATPAMAFQAKNGLTVIETAGQIQVQASPGQSAPESWCAAGDFALSRLGLPPATKLWRVSAAPRHRAEGVVFSLSPEGAAQKSGVLQLGEDDAAFTAAAAQALCDRW